MGKHWPIPELMIKPLRKLLQSGSTTKVLYWANMAVAFSIALLSRNTVLGDTSSYLGLAEGIRHGNFSMWWEIAGDYPDTFRTPGFPLLIAIVTSLTGTWKAMLGLNLVLYGIALFLTLRSIQFIDPRPQARNVFLLLLLPLLNVPFYIGQVYPEIPSLAAISAVLYILTRKGAMGTGMAIGLGLLYGFIFQCKPVFLLFPFLMPIVERVVLGRWAKLSTHLMAIVVFVITLMPFGFWNLKHHGLFSVTPLEGGAGVMHMGVWAGKIPGYTEKVYWHNFTGDELVQFTPEDSVPGNIKEYEQEWATINAQLAPLLTAKDTLMLASGALLSHSATPTYNTAYTLERERLLRNMAIEDAIKWPGYIFAYKSYSAVRLWVIGIQRGDFAKATLAQKAGLLYGPITTGGLFLLFILVVTIALIHRKFRIKDTWPFLLFVAYFGLIHIPFVIQARYTTPVRFAMLVVLSLTSVALFAPTRKDEEKSGLI